MHLHLARLTSSLPQVISLETSLNMNQPNSTPQRIKALDQSVVNKIAAGEIIVAPVNALKELIENSVDAGSTSIEIVVKDGGLKLLQITDNGHGINRDDMPILCERFTTSKLKSFDDLQSIGTYGFRGEALASISMIAHLTITTKTSDSVSAWRAVYGDGKLKPPKPGQSADPKPCAGRGGTQITVEDLFYNTPSRRRAFRSPAEEYSKILDVVGRYAVHCNGVAFSCKKHGDTDVGLATASNASLRDRIRRVHGSAVANELIDLEVADEHLGFEAKGMLSNANYHVKKTTLLLFINDRSVESGPIKKALDATYSAFLPKGGHPFVYLALKIEPSRVDVNVHPTKREVNFLREDEIIEMICEAVQDKLAAVDASRSYSLTQTLLPGAQLENQDTAPQARQDSRKKAKANNLGISPGVPGSSRTQTKKPYENNTVRVDARDQKITSMLQPVAEGSDQARLAGGDHGEYTYDDSRQWRDVGLKSLKILREKTRNEANNALSELFMNHIYVGLIDEGRRLAAVQHGVRLYLIDYAAVSYELFYQIGLSDFRNFGVIRLNPPLPLREILKIAAKEEFGDGHGGDGQGTDHSGDEEVPIDSSGACVSRVPDLEGAIKTVESLLLDHRTMLRDYFSMEINGDGELVQWDVEEDCFDTFLRELALFYVPETLPTAPQHAGVAGAAAAAGQPAANEGEIETYREDPAMVVRRKELGSMVEGVLFPAFRKRLIPTNKLLGSVTEIANLKGLYRIFERSC
ncbi:DNA mismatch repair protein Mlh1 [Geopyxis carbonaria]|nr:DNA mismatch repair protein Mlh1 [Geopyxis carbonaria]